MDKGLLFWIVFLIVFIMYVVGNRSKFANGDFWLGGDIFQFILIAILGWAVFGPIVH